MLTSPERQQNSTRWSDEMARRNPQGWRNYVDNQRREAANDAQYGLRA
jgi:hypothetical protein